MLCLLPPHQNNSYVEHISGLDGIWKLIRQPLGGCGVAIPKAGLTRLGRSSPLQARKKGIKLLFDVRLLCLQN
jgi:hypothetical protein